MRCPPLASTLSPGHPYGARRRGVELIPRLRFQMPQVPSWSHNLLPQFLSCISGHALPLSGAWDWLMGAGGSL